MKAYCMLCGKTFTGDDTECGWMRNGEPMCEIEKHDSDCARHNMPAWPNGECDCSLKKQGEDE